VSRNSRNKEGGRQTGPSWSGRAAGAGRPGGSSSAGSSGKSSGSGRPSRATKAARVTGGSREVDLHLPPGHSGTEALERQLARVRGELNSAIRAGEKEIIFIHGAGSGKLKEAIRELLATGYHSCTFRDAPFARYGYGGATAVTIKK